MIASNRKSIFVGCAELSLSGSHINFIHKHVPVTTWGSTRAIVTKFQVSQPFMVCPHMWASSGFIIIGTKLWKITTSRKQITVIPLGTWCTSSKRCTPFHCETHGQSHFGCSQSHTGQYCFAIQGTLKTLNHFLLYQTQCCNTRMAVSDTWWRFHCFWIWQSLKISKTRGNTTVNYMLNQLSCMPHTLYIIMLKLCLA